MVFSETSGRVESNAGGAGAVGRVCHFTVKECGGVQGAAAPSAGGTWGHRPRGGGRRQKMGKKARWWVCL